MQFALAHPTTSCIHPVCGLDSVSESVIQLPQLWNVSSCIMFSPRSFLLVEYLIFLYLDSWLLNYFQYFISWFPVLFYIGCYVTLIAAISCQFCVSTSVSQFCYVISNKNLSISVDIEMRQSLFLHKYTMASSLCAIWLAVVGINSCHLDVPEVQ